MHSLGHVLQHFGGQNDVSAVHWGQSRIVGQGRGHVGDGHAFPQSGVQIRQPQGPAFGEWRRLTGPIGVAAASPLGESLTAGRALQHRGVSCVGPVPKEVSDGRRRAILGEIHHHLHVLAERIGWRRRRSRGWGWWRRRRRRSGWNVNASAGCRCFRELNRQMGVGFSSGNAAASAGSKVKWFRNSDFDYFRLLFSATKGQRIFRRRIIRPFILLKMLQIQHLLRIVVVVAPL